MTKFTVKVHRVLVRSAPQFQKKREGKPDLEASVIDRSSAKALSWEPQAADSLAALTWLNTQ